MSKSAEADGSRLNLLDSPDTIVNKIKRAKTDAYVGLEFDNPERPEARNLLTIYSLVTGVSMARTPAALPAPAYPCSLRLVFRVLAVCAPGPATAGGAESACVAHAAVLWLQEHCACAQFRFVASVACSAGGSQGVSRRPYVQESALVGVRDCQGGCCLWRSAVNQAGYGVLCLASLGLCRSRRWWRSAA